MCHLPNREPDVLRARSRCFLRRAADPLNVLELNPYIVEMRAIVATELAHAADRIDRAIAALVRARLDNR